MATSFIQWVQKASRRRFFRYGVPFVTLMVAGSFGLKQFASLRYEYRKGKQITQQEAEKFGVKMKADEDKTLEKVYEDYQKQDLDTWENIRGPRPWEDSKEIQDMQRKKGDGQQMQTTGQ